MHTTPVPTTQHLTTDRPRARGASAAADAAGESGQRFYAQPNPARPYTRGINIGLITGETVRTTAADTNRLGIRPQTTTHSRTHATVNALATTEVAAEPLSRY